MARQPGSSDDVQSAGEIRATDLADEVGIPADDELFTGSGQSDVEPLPRALEHALLVDHHDDGTALESLKAQDVSVEDLVGVPERVPVGLVSVPLPLGLLGWPRSSKVSNSIYAA